MPWALPILPQLLLPWQLALPMLPQWQLPWLSELDCPLGIGIYRRAWPS